MNTEQLLQAMEWRYAVKKFDAQKKIDPKTWNALEETLILTPSSYGLQPWKFVVITNEALKAQLTPLSWKQTQVADCSHYVVFASKTQMDEQYISHFVESIAKTRGVTADTLASYQKMMVGDLVKGARSTWIKEWAARQAYIALGNFMTAAACLNIDTCPMEGIQPAEYDKVLELEGSGYHTVVACAAGYRASDDKYQSAKKVRFAKNEIVQHKN